MIAEEIDPACFFDIEMQGEDTSGGHGIRGYGFPGPGDIVLISEGGNFFKQVRVCSSMDSYLLRSGNGAEQEKKQNDSGGVEH